jgi:YbbR domain-containing protein
MRFLLNNFWLKLLALVIGLLVWVHVATEKTYTYQLKLPVTRVDLKAHQTLAVQPPDSLAVIISAKGKQLLQTAWRDQGIRINASKLLAGEYVLNLTPENTSLISPSKNIRLDEVVSPTPIDLNIDVESKLELPVIPDITVTPDDGYAVSGKVEVTPPNVVVTGAKSVVNKLKAVYTESRELGTLRNSVSLIAPLVPPKGLAMKLEPDSVTIAVTIVPVRTRIYDHLPIVVYNAPPGHVVSTNPSTVRVELSGPPGEIDLLNRNAITVSVDVRQRDAVTGLAPVKIDCPANFRVKKTSSDSVRLINPVNVRPGS